MKRAICLAALLCLLTLCSACVAAEAKPANYIAPVELTPEQQDMLMLLGHDQAQYLLYEYKTTEPYKYADFWVEIYKDGELIEERANGFSFYNDSAIETDGEIAIVIENNNGYQWAFRTNWARNSFNEPNPHYIPNAGASGGASGKLAIEDNKELVLHAALFSATNTSFSSDLQAYVDEPENLKDYTYVHLVKCRFSNTGPKFDL